MLNPNFFILYVDAPLVSEALYRDLLGFNAVESSPTFVMFVFPTGNKLGLWSKHTVLPAASSPSGSGEMVLTVSDRDAVQDTCLAWKKRGLRILQEPQALEFGFTFVALDPDGHRLRVYNRED